MSVLCARPFRDVTIDEIMRRTGLSRPAFYVYFRDLHDLVVRLFERFAAEFFGVADRWLLSPDDHPGDARAAMEGVVNAFAKHGRFIRAAFEASCYDKRVDRAYRSIIDRLVGAIAAHIRVQAERGRVRAVHPDETASALVRMTESYLRERFGGDDGMDRERVTETLLAIWLRTLYD